MEIDGKMIYKSKISLKLNDTLIFTSDGAVYAGIGENMNFGWQRDQIIEFMEEYYRPDFTAKRFHHYCLTSVINYMAEGPVTIQPFALSKSARENP